MRALRPGPAGLAALLLCLAPGRRDLDVAIPPGSPLEWTAASPAYTPARKALFPVTAKSEDKQFTVSKSSTETDMRFANAFGQVRILTWDLAAHLEWISRPQPGPVTGLSSLRPPPPRFGDPLYWLALAPLLRLLLHPDALSRPEVLAHLVELGEPVLPVLSAAAGEHELDSACKELRALIRLDTSGVPVAPAGATPRASSFARFVLEECLRDEPVDPTDDFGKRLCLFAEEAEPLLTVYAEHPCLALARNAVSALGRYETRSSAQFLVLLASRTEDPVTLVRALAGLRGYRGALPTGALIERLRKTNTPVLQVAMIGALGRLGVREAAPLLLEIGDRARSRKDSDLLISVLSALARIPWTKPQPEVRKLCERVRLEARDIGAPADENELRPDVTDSPSLRAEILTQLAWLACSQADPSAPEPAKALLALPKPAPLDARLSELGAAGTDPLGGIAPLVRFLFLEGLVRAGPAGIEELVTLARSKGLETILRGRALALLPFDKRAPIAPVLLQDESEPVELRIQTLEILIDDAHPRVEDLCRALLAREVLRGAAPSSGDLFLALRAVRHLSESGRLRAADLLPLFPYVQRTPEVRQARLAELHELCTSFVQAAAERAGSKELKRRARELVAFVQDNGLNVKLDDGMRDQLVETLRDMVEDAHKQREERAELARLAKACENLLVGAAETTTVETGRNLFEAKVPLAEEIVLALGRLHEPLALELLLTVLRSHATSLRAYACLAVGMRGDPAVARELLPHLLDEEPFVRFAASESLRRLATREEIQKPLAIDWMYGPREERVAAAEELRRCFLDTPR